MQPIHTHAANANARSYQHTLAKLMKEYQTTPGVNQRDDSNTVWSCLSNIVCLCVIPLGYLFNPYTAGVGRCRTEIQLTHYQLWVPISWSAAFMRWPIME